MSVQDKKSSDAPPAWGSGGSGGGGGGKPKPGQNPLLDHRYGTKQVQGKPGSKPKTVYENRHGLGPILGRTQIAGVLNLFGQDPLLQTPDIQAARAASGIAGSNAVKPFTADQVMYMFDHASPGTRAAIQDMMYRAGGLYDKKYVPTNGAPLTKQDRDAFKKFMIGVAANPGQGGVGDLLNQAAGAGDANGVNAPASKAVYNPLITTLTSPEDIKNTANEVGKQLHGTYMSPDQMKVFTAAYQTMEKVYQEQLYTANGGDLSTGVVDPDKAQAATIIKPPSSDSAAFQNELAASIRNNNPEQFGANTLTDHLDAMLAKLKTNTSATQVGPL